MPLEVVGRPQGGVSRLVISCETCGLAVDDKAIASNGGLTEMGWERRFDEGTRKNQYFCPKHK